MTSARTEFIAVALYNSFRTNLKWDHWSDQTEQAKDTWRLHARAAELAAYEHLKVDAEMKQPCTCHPDDNPPRPCPQRYAYSECVAAAILERIKAEEVALITLPSDSPSYDQGFRCALQTIEAAILSIAPPEAPESRSRTLTNDGTGEIK